MDLQNKCSDLVKDTKVRLKVKRSRKWLPRRAKVHSRTDNFVVFEVQCNHGKYKESFTYAELLGLDDIVKYEVIN